MREQLVRAWLGPGHTRAGFHRHLGALLRLNEQVRFLVWVAQLTIQFTEGKLVYLGEGEKTASLVLDSFSLRSLPKLWFRYLESDKEMRTWSSLLCSLIELCTVGYWTDLPLQLLVRLRFSEGRN